MSVTGTTTTSSFQSMTFSPQVVSTRSALLTIGRSGSARLDTCTISGSCGQGVGSEFPYVAHLGAAMVGRRATAGDERQRGDAEAGMRRAPSTAGPTPVPTPAGMRSSASLLALQRTAGNAAVGRWL